MRAKSESKKSAILKATLKLINELGFHGTSMSKIAKESGVAPATIYIYFPNKEQLINDLYLDTKETLVNDLFCGYCESLDTKEAFVLLSKNWYNCMLKHQMEFCFVEQYANSPYISNVSKEEGRRRFARAYAFFENAMQRGDMRRMPIDVAIAYFISPLMFLAKQNLATPQTTTEKDLDSAIDNAWKFFAR